MFLVKVQTTSTSIMSLIRPPPLEDMYEACSKCNARQWKKTLEIAGCYRCKRNETHGSCSNCAQEFEKPHLSNNLCFSCANPTFELNLTCHCGKMFTTVEEICNSGECMIEVLPKLVTQIKELEQNCQTLKKKMEEERELYMKIIRIFVSERKTQ